MRQELIIPGKIDGRKATLRVRDGDKTMIFQPVHEDDGVHFTKRISPVSITAVRRDRLTQAEFAYSVDTTHPVVEGADRRIVCWVKITSIEVATPQSYPDVWHVISGFLQENRVAVIGGERFRYGRQSRFLNRISVLFGDHPHPAFRLGYAIQFVRVNADGTEIGG